MQGPPVNHEEFVERANELISLVEEYVKEADINEDEDFDPWSQDQRKIERIMLRFLDEHGFDEKGFDGMIFRVKSDVLDALPMVLVFRAVTPWTFKSIERFWNHFEEIYFGRKGYKFVLLDGAIGKIWKKMTKLQLCAKRFLARKRLAELKQNISGDICAICVQPLIMGCQTTQCGHVFHTKCIGSWKAIKPQCPMCRKGL